MKKISKIMKCLILGGFLLSVNSQRAEAFLFPPMPWDPVIDIPNDAGKIIGQGLKIKHTLSSGLTFDNALGLSGLKGGLIDGEWKKLKNAVSPEMDKDGASKTPGKGKVASSSELSISEESKDEEDFFNAYHTLFLTHDFDADGVNGATAALLETAYKNKAEEYRQDIAIDTYLSAKMMENYLATVDETLNRLEDCQSGGFSEDKCVFFGMKMANTTTDENTPSTAEGEEDNKAQLAATRNAYIVTMTYDRLLRIIEDLTATEAIFQSAKQLGIAKPIAGGEQQSSAEDYVNKNYQFAYADSQSHTLAKGTSILKYNNKAKECDGSENPEKCPFVNKKGTTVKSIKNTEVLKDLQPIEDNIDKAIVIHNLKSGLPQLKSQYRQYLLQVEIHKKAKELVKASDKCVVDFLQRHDESGNIASEWYGGAEPQGENRFIYENRKGISGALIREYDEKSTNIAIGTEKECDGYYEENSCPAGYDWNSQNCCENNNKMCACEIEIITEEATETEEITEMPEDYTGGANVAKIESKYKNRDDTDGFMDGTKADTIVQDSRKSAETTWYLGRDKLLETMSKYNLNFNPWNDQKMLQAEYLRNKYRNIRLIIKSTDQAVASYKIASDAVQGYNNTEDTATKYIIAAARCESIEKAEALAKAKYCTSEYVNCDSKGSNGVIITKRTKRAYDKNGKPYEYSVPDIIENQKVSLNNTCTYTKGETTANASDICLTPSCLVKTYFSKAYGNAEGFYDAAKGKGRIVAVNKLEDVITERKNQEENVKKVIREQQTIIKTTEDAIEDAIAALSTTNKTIDVARKNKNVASNELSASKQRLNAIKTEENTLKNRKDGNNIEDKCVKEKSLGELNNERSCLERGIPGAAYSCNSCKNLSGLSKEEQNCQKRKLSCNAYLTTFTTKDGMLDKANNNSYIAIPSATAMQDRYQAQIDAKTAQLNELKERVKSLQEQLATQTEKFADEYLKAESKAQEEIETKNQEYEEFMENADGETQRYQMRNAKIKECYKKGPLGIGCKREGPKRIEKNNLASTYTNIISSGNLNKVMTQELNNVFFAGGKVQNLLTKAGIPNKIVVDGTFTAIGLPAGTVAATTLAGALKDSVVKVAANELEKQIEKADREVEQAVKEAEKTVETFINSHNISGEGLQTPSQSYLEKPSAAHQQLLKTLRRISKTVIDGENLFGIPEDDDFAAMQGEKEIEEGEIIADSAFFVALPARGNNYRGKGNDEDAGRDYIAPRDMLSSLPPLREIFYFSAADYEVLPQNNGKPVLTELLNCKYFANNGKCEVEYLPEVWMHLLARPNLRQDKKYQQSFVERSFNSAKLNELVQNKLANNVGAQDSDYRAIIGRAGVYPCRTGGKIIDMSGGDGVGNMKFKTRNTLPAGISSVPTCQEVTMSGTKIYHLLADHNKKNVSDTEQPGATNEEMYSKHSELGQLLTKNMAYRPLQKNIQEYLNNAANSNNDITRQKAELASFKRNVMGSFLDAVTTEYNARKNMESSAETIKETMKSLCSQLEDVGISVANCENRALATSYKDTSYFEYEKNDTYGKIKCSNSNSNFYEQIFCDLDNKKASYVNAAKALLKTTKAAVEKKKLSGDAKAYVDERLEKIENYISDTGTLIVDNNEVSTIQPNIDAKEINSALRTAKTNRRVMLDSAEEGLQAMENQSQAVAYCPIY